MGQKFGPLAVNGFESYRVYIRILALIWELIKYQPFVSIAQISFVSFFVCLFVSFLSFFLLSNFPRKMTRVRRDICVDISSELYVFNDI